MKCEKIIQNIEEYFNGWAGELDPKTMIHLETCRDCKMSFMAHEKASGLITRIRDFEPELRDPSGLTEDIMGALPDSGNDVGAGKTMRYYTIFRWSLSAAAVILFFLFAFEQYLVLDKINRLETQYQNVSKENIGGKNSPMYNAWEIRTLKKYNHLKANNKELFQKISSMANNI